MDTLLPPAKRQPSGPASITIDLVTIPSGGEHQPWGRCPEFKATLSLSQPDPTCPARFLGVCEDCRGWFVIMLGPGQVDTLKIVQPTCDCSEISPQGPCPG
jgi:hypothetical protein